MFWFFPLPQAPGTPIIARQVTPTTIIKQVSQAQTTVQPTTTLQRPPVVQVSFYQSNVSMRYISLAENLLETARNAGNRIAKSILARRNIY